MKIDKIINTSIVTVEIDDSLRTIKEIFDNVHFHHLLVVDSGKLFGIISDRDLLKALCPTAGTDFESNLDAITLNKRAHQILTRKPITLSASSDIHEAVDIFINNSISCIPIVNEELKPVGILSWKDLLKTLKQLL